MISFITPTQGNPIALKRTMDSLKGICNEFIVGSVCLFQKDEKIIESYKNEFNTKLVRLPFNFIYSFGFSKTLNLLASHATNRIVIYLNVGEVIEKSEGGILDKIIPEYNCYYIDNQHEKHRWFRCYDKNEMEWSGLIHEEIVGEHRPFYKPLFTFGDTEKDMSDPFKAAVYNDGKEITYWRELMRIVDEPEVLGATSIGWVQFAKDNYQSMKDRLAKKGNRPKAFELGDLQMYLDDIYSNPEFEKERFESNHIIEFQGDPKYLNK
jgi:hypothetical protein